MRGRDRRNARVSIKRGPPIAQQFSALFTVNDVRFDADNVSGSDFVDYQDVTHKLALAAGGAVSIATDALFNGAKTAAFTGGNRYLSSRAASSWRFLHDGTGCSVFLVLAPTNLTGNQFALATRNASGGGDDIGAQILFLGSVPAIAVLAGGVAVFAATVSGSLSNNVPTTLSYTHQESASPEYAAYQGSTVLGSGTTAVTPSAGDASGSLTIGSLTTGAGGASFKFRGLYAFKRVLTAGEISVVRSYITATTGVSG